MLYDEYLLSKIKVAEKHGIVVDAARMHQSSKPEQLLIVPWALELGAALIATDAGSGKTHMGIEAMRLLHEERGGKILIVTELAAMDTWVSGDPEVGEGARLGVKMEYVTNTEEAMASACSIVVTNYERVRDGGIGFADFTGVWLDEGNYVKNMASETTDVLRVQLSRVKYKYIATATPCPNELLEIINYAHVLGICDRGQILTRFFQRNSTKAGELTLHEQHAEDFYTWLFSWSVWMTVPSDLGLSDEGQVLPELVVNWHEVPLERAIYGGVERDGQGKIYAETAASLPEAARVKRESMDARIDYAIKIMLDNEGVETVSEIKEHYILWHHLEDERRLLKGIFGLHDGYGEIYGKQLWEDRVKNVEQFTKGELQILGTKPDVSGVGCNFQKHCHRAIAIGVNHSWDEFWQAIIKRIYRYGQKFTTVIDVLFVREEWEIVNNIKRKWREHVELRDTMAGYQKAYGLGNKNFIEEKKRSLMRDRVVHQPAAPAGGDILDGHAWKLVNTDAVYEWMGLPDNSIDMILSSYPFGNHYEYCDKYNDFGHNATNADFFRQMEFLIPQLLRTLKPGRIAAIHLKNRIHYGSVTGLGFSVFHRFTHAVCDAMERAGFYTLGFHYVPTCVVGENNQTYRLTFGEMQKDSTKMGSGIPEEIWLFRKAPSSTENAYADEPVMHNIKECPSCHHQDPEAEFFKAVPINEKRLNKHTGEIEPGHHIAVRCPKCKAKLGQNDLVPVSGNQGYTLSHWQIDADSFWGEGGNRYLTPDELRQFGIKQLRKWWNQYNPNTVYNYEKHVELLRALDKAGKLSRTWTTLPLRSNTPYIWNDVNRMQGLNVQQRHRKKQNHICPMPFDEVDRLIELYSNPGDIIADPFGGIGTTGVRALKKGRRALLTELNREYAACAAHYMREAEIKSEVPTLFDLLRVNAA